MRGIRVFMVMTGVILAGFCAAPLLSHAHCDTLDGPVIADAKQALEKGDVTPVLKWVRKEDEGQIREMFAKTVAVRASGREAKELADMYFFETLVRIHRAGEGAPYTGLKPAGAVEPAVAEADRALDSGSPEKLIAMITGAVEKGIRERFERTKEKKAHAGHGVDYGREFVASYVDFTHYVERLHADATVSQAAHGSQEKTPGGHQH